MCNLATLLIVFLEHNFDSGYHASSAFQVAEVKRPCARGTDTPYPRRVIELDASCRQVFPHYPSHGVDHSDRIIEQLSHLLFNNTRPVVRFSTAEVYCLLLRRYPHDMGMVVSPETQRHF